MAVTLIFVVAAVVVVLTMLDYIPVIVALPAIGIVFAVLLGYLLRRNSGPRPPPE
jgi:hypothetical protein